MAAACGAGTSAFRAYGSPPQRGASVGPRGKKNDDVETGSGARGSLSPPEPHSNELQAYEALRTQLLLGACSHAADSVLPLRVFADQGMFAWLSAFGARWSSCHCVVVAPSPVEPGGEPRRRSEFIRIVASVVMSHRCKEARV